MLEAIRGADGLWRLRFRKITNRQAFLTDDAGDVLTWETKKEAEAHRRIHERGATGWAPARSDHFARRGNRHR